MTFTVGDQFGAMVFGAVVGALGMYFGRALFEKVVAWVKGKLGK